MIWKSLYPAKSKKLTIFSGNAINLIYDNTPREIPVYFRNVMKRKAIIQGLLLLMAAMLITGCKKDNDEELKAQEMRLLEQYLTNNNITQEPTASGLYHIPIIEGNGRSLNDSTWIEIEYAGELVDGTVFGTNMDSVARANGLYQENFLYGPSRFNVGNLNIAGLTEGLQLMNVGGRSRFIIPSDLAFGSGSTERIPPYSTLIYTIDLLVAFDNPEHYEEDQIRSFLLDNDLPDEPLESGLYYFELVEGTGDTVRFGDQVQAWYTGTFYDGRIFDSNIGGDLLVRTIPDENLIQGFNEGLLLMREGSKGLMIIPYYLAYGILGAKDNFGVTRIPPYKTLFYEVEVVKVN
jgi:FKBP-type peptidyl-prolyl cis-trans isomerase